MLASRCNGTTGRERGYLGAGLESGHRRQRFHYWKRQRRDKSGSMTEGPPTKLPILSRLGGEFDADGIAVAGVGAGIVNVLTETLYPLISTFWTHCPVRLVAFGVCMVVTARGRYEGVTRMNRTATWVFVTLCLYAGALGVNKMASEVKADITRDEAGAIERQWPAPPSQEKPHRPGDGW